MPSTHIKGHQDEHQKLPLKALTKKRADSTLIWQVQLNIVADRLVHIARSNISDHGKHNFDLIPA
eukprot:10989847-Ditylum_brightwellii.AAC.1